jgi:transcriptional regulator with XRE-family HTH domain
MRKWLVEIRKAANMSQYATAAKAGISQSYYASIETGVRGKPLSVTIAKKIATALGFDWTRFYEEADEAERDST